MDIGSVPTTINMPSVDAYVLGVCDLISRTFSFQIRRTNNIFSSFVNSWINNIDILNERCHFLLHEDYYVAQEQL